MARCKQCNKWGLFLQLDNNGICLNCQILKKEKEEEELHKRKLREEEIKKRKEEAIEKLNCIPMVEIAISDEKINDRDLYELENIKYSNITPKGKYTEFVVVDTETTGLQVSKNKIVEISAIRFVQGKPTEIFSSLINPVTAIPRKASEINGITDEMVKNFPTIKQVIKAFDIFVGGSNVIAHNLDFDLKFIHKSGSNIIDTKRKYFCTLKQAQKMLKKPKVKWDKEYGIYYTDYESDYDVEDHKLETLCDYFDIIKINQHRGYADAYCTGLLFLQLINWKQDFNC